MTFLDPRTLTWTHNTIGYHVQLLPAAFLLYSLRAASVPHMLGHSVHREREKKLFSKFSIKSTRDFRFNKVSHFEVFIFYLNFYLMDIIDNNTVIVLIVVTYNACFHKS